MSGFDERALPRLERMVGAKVLGEVLDLYLENTPLRLRAVRDGLDAEDQENTARALHDLKSSAGMIGASTVQQLAETMERAAWRGDLAAVRANLKRLETDLARAETLLQEARQRRNT